MGFGPVRDCVDGGDAADADAVIDAIDRIAAELARVRETCRWTGMPLAEVYIEGAIDALAYGVEAAVAGSRRIRGTAATLSIGPVDLRLERTGVDPYAMVVGGTAVPPPPAAGPSLGAAILGNTRIAERLRADELAAALMAAALSHADWIHLASDGVFYGDPLAARAVVSTVAGRDTFPGWTRRQMDGMIDRESADLLAGLGWRRMTGAALPAAA